MWVSDPGGLSLNGVPLDNPAMGWFLADGSKTLLMISNTLTEVTVPGVAGSTVVAVTDQPAVLPLKVFSPAAFAETLLVLLRSSPLVLSRTSFPGREVAVIMQAPDYEGFLGDQDTRVSFSLKLPHPYWRDHDEATVEATLTSSTTVTAFPGSSAPILDGLIRVTGPVSAFQLTVGAAVVGYPKAIAAGSAVVYDVASQSARKVAAGAWSGGSDVSGDLSLPFPRLILAPTWTTDPAVRSVQVKCDATGTTGSSKLAVKGKGSYVLG